MKGRIRLITKDRFIFYTSFVTLFFLIISIILMIFSYSNLPPLIPIFNSMPWGISRLYDTRIIIFSPLILVGIVVLNTTVGLSIYKNFTLLSRIISFNSLLFCLLATLAYLQILFLIY